MNPFISFSLLFMSLFTPTLSEPTHPTQKPSILLIPAAFSPASVYDLVAAQLSAAGYDDVLAIDLPSVGARAAHVDRTPDIKVVQTALAKRLLKGRNVVLVGNSYGATVICDALRDFEDKSSLDKRSGPSGKILGVIFVSASCDYFPYCSLIPNTIWY
jgi:pimeloyl-ACP methyl ester carboxylesterase